MFNEKWCKLVEMVLTYVIELFVVDRSGQRYRYITGAISLHKDKWKCKIDKICNRKQNEEGYYKILSLRHQ